VTRPIAVVIANGYLATPNGKTAHGMLRGSDRFTVGAVIDPSSAGRDAGEVAFGEGGEVGVRCVATVAEAIEAAGGDPSVALIGVATHGGVLESAIREVVLECIKAGLGVVNGLHDGLANDRELVAAAAESNVELVDLRRVKPRSELHFWTGAIYNVAARRVAVLGTDCAVGKRTTAWLLVEALRRRKLTAEMIYTGQTGWLQGARFGFILDATINDYVSGELEQALVACDLEVHPDVMIVEGQSSLRNPSGPCGAELILSADAKKVVLQHAPGRVYFEGYESFELEIGDLGSEIATIRLYGAEVVCVAVNPSDTDPEVLAEWRRQIEIEHGVPTAIIPAEINKVVDTVLGT
jgi:uncharacterized NAD-dependent epimerase/dehydratase family protein